MSIARVKTILLVEDEPSAALSERGCLAGLGYAVRLAPSGEEAREAAGGREPLDLAIVDMGLGGMGAAASADELLERRELPILFLSGRESPEAVKETEAIPSYGYLSRSASPAVLAASIDAALRLFAAKREPAQVAAERDKYRELVDHSYDIIYTIGADGVLTFVSEAWTDLLGYPTEEVIGRDFRLFVHPDDVEECLAWLKRVIETGIRKDGVEYRVRHRDGSWHWYASSAVPLRDASGAVVGFEGIARDISERKGIEERLKAKSEELDLYFSSALDLLCIADMDGHFVRVNPEWEKVLGYSISELEGRFFLDFVHPDDREGTLAAMEALRAQEQVLSFVNRYRSKDGSWRWIEWRSHPKGDLIFAAARDITDRKLAEESVRSLLAEKEMILKETHHRLKNNMQAVSGFLSLQMDAAKDAASREALKAAAGRMQSMLSLYTKLYQSADYDGISVSEYLFDLIDQVVENFRGAAKVRVEKRVEDFRLEPKRMQPLGIIVNELVTNSMKYAFAGRTEGLILFEAGSREGRARVSVMDDGIGVPEAVMLEKAGGFGLELVRGLAQQLGGEVRIESEGGTKACLEFPL